MYNYCGCVVGSCIWDSKIYANEKERWKCALSAELLERAHREIVGTTIQSVMDLMPACV